jgi:hypothetical protein
MPVLPLAILRAAALQIFDAGTLSGEGAGVKIQLPINWSRPNAGPWLIVAAEIVDIAPHVASVAAFAVHKYPKDEHWYAVWAVTNVETGFRVGHGRTRQEAIDMATEKLKTKSPEQISAAMAEAHRTCEIARAAINKAKGEQ